MSRLWAKNAKYSPSFLDPNLASYCTVVYIFLLRILLRPIYSQLSFLLTSLPLLFNPFCYSIFCTYNVSLIHYWILARGGTHCKKGFRLGWGELKHEGEGDAIVRDNNSCVHCTFFYLQGEKAEKKGF